MSAGTKRLARRLRALFRPGAVDREVDEEMRQHLELEAEEIARVSGVSQEEARRRALVAFGGVSRYQEEHRDARGIRWLEQTLQDLRHAARGLRRSPGFTLSAVGVLALGIGATTAVFSAVNAVLRNPNHDTLAVLFYRGFPSFSTVDYRAIEQQQRSFTAVGAYRGSEAAFRVAGEPERVQVGRVTAGYFRVLNVRPVAGRLIEPRDEPVGADPVVVVSHALAERALGGPAGAVGRTVTVDGTAHTVIGVLPAEGEVLATRADVWPALQLAEPERRGPFGMLVLARLKPTATFESATSDVTGISERVFAQWSPGGAMVRTAVFEAIPVRTAFLAAPSRMLRIFSVGVALVLLIGVANVASLMLVRAIGRSQEVSVRAVLGASRAQLVRLFVTESALLVAAGAGLGIAVGAMTLRLLIAYGPRMPGLTPASLDLGAVLFAAAVAVGAGVVVGIYPVLMLLRRGPTELSGARTIGGRHAGKIRSGFVVAQFALALPLLAVSGLLLVSFMRMQRVDPGFDPRPLLTAQITLPSGQYEQGPATRAYWTNALARVRDIPGVVQAGLSSTIGPDDFGSSNDNFNLIDKPAPPGAEEPNGPWPFADPEYFAALDVPLLDGRLFTPADTGALPVVAVSRSWANKYYPGESPLGKTMIRGGCTECIPTTVVGVVDDVRYSGLAGPMDALYTPVSEDSPRSLYLYVRTAGSPAELMEPVREALRSVDPTVPLDDVATMEQRLHTSMAQPRQWASLLGGFAAAALGLAAVGVFGMLSYMVGTRRREIGVRMALGAAPRSIMRMVVGSGLTHAVAGSLLGLAAALAGTRALTAVLFDVSPGDPGTLALATLALLAVALLACWLPARRAAGIPPLEAIRHE